MTEQPTPVAPATLARDARFYREQAADCQRMIDGLDRRKSIDRAALAGFEKDRDLWLQLAAEIDRYLDGDVTPDASLFD